MRKCAVCDERSVMEGASRTAVRAQTLDLCNECMRVGQVRRDRAKALGLRTREPLTRGKVVEASGPVGPVGLVVGEDGRDLKLAVVLGALECVKETEEGKELLRTWPELRALICDGLAGPAGPAGRKAR